MTRYFVHLAYKGTHYHGWQFQPNAITIQETINKVFTIVLKSEISLTGAGRTDTGVHARNFYAHFDFEEKKLNNIEKLIFKLNSLLPNDILIFGIYKVPKNAHTRFDAIERVYKYYISPKKEIFLDDYCWRYSVDLNIDLMNEAAKYLYTHTDFTSFSKLHTDVKTNNCTINIAEWTTENNLIVFTIAADRFLRNMVRSIVGTLIEIGNGKKTVSSFTETIEKKDRNAAGRSVPAKGLFLEKVIYPYPIG